MELEVGAIVTVAGVQQRHLGGGRFEPVRQPEPLLKRFDPNDGEPLHRGLPCS